MSNSVHEGIVYSVLLLQTAANVVAVAEAEMVRVVVR